MFSDVNKQLTAWLIWTGMLLALGQSTFREESMEPMTLSLVGRNSIVREGLSRLLAESGIRVIQSVSQSSLLEWAEPNRHSSNPIILVDCGADVDLESVRTMQPYILDARFVLLVDEFNFGMMIKAFQMGVHGYVIKDISCDSLISALHLVAGGEKYLPSQLASSLDGYRPQPAESSLGSPDVVAKLSDRETDILRCLIAGCPNKVISHQLEISEATVKVHVKAVLRKLGVQNRTQAAIWGAGRGVRGFGIDEPIGSAVPLPAHAIAPYMNQTPRMPMHV